jgi:hypothetical protein
MHATRKEWIVHRDRQRIATGTKPCASQLHADGTPSTAGNAATVKCNGKRSDRTRRDWHPCCICPSTGLYSN